MHPEPPDTAAGFTARINGEDILFLQGRGPDDAPLYAGMSADDIVHVYDTPPGAPDAP